MGVVWAANQNLCDFLEPSGVAQTRKASAGQTFVEESSIWMIAFEGLSPGIAGERGLDVILWICRWQRMSGILGRPG